MQAKNAYVNKIIQKPKNSSTDTSMKAVII